MYITSEIKSTKIQTVYKINTPQVWKIIVCGFYCQTYQSSKQVTSCLPAVYTLDRQDVLEFSLTRKPAQAL